MWGGIFGLRYVENERWGGLTLTLLLSTFGIAFAFPLSILLALGRRSEMPLVRWLSIAYIELIRGVPLISVLFMASVMFPLFLPAGSVHRQAAARPAGDDLICRSLSCRSGARRPASDSSPARRSGPSSRTHATGSARGYVNLPQALPIAIPPLVNTFIGFFKDTSLVVIIGLFDFLTTIKVSLSEPAWTGFGVEAYLFAALGYFLFCYPMSRYSQALERQGARGTGINNLREN